MKLLTVYFYPLPYYFLLLFLNILKLSYQMLPTYVLLEDKGNERNFDLILQFQNTRSSFEGTLGCLYVRVPTCFLTTRCEHLHHTFLTPSQTWLTAHNRVLFYSFRRLCFRPICEHHHPLNRHDHRVGTNAFLWIAIHPNFLEFFWWCIRNPEPRVQWVAAHKAQQTLCYYWNISGAVSFTPDHDQVDIQTEFSTSHSK
jgi:hypothetical protein